MGWATYIAGHFFTNSSGHPALQAKFVFEARLAVCAGAATSFRKEIILLKHL
jgi:hypothetical protein